MKKIMLTAGVALALVGCGGSSSSAPVVEVPVLERGIENDTSLKLLPYGGGKAEAMCVRDGADEYRYKCYVDVVGGDNDGATYTLDVTCDATGSCVWKPE